VKIAIVGAGMTGAYLNRLLGNRGHKVDIFGRDPGTKCGINPCAWGTSKGFSEYVKTSGHETEKYILRHSDQVVMDGLRIKADLWTFNKPRLINDFLKGVSVNHGPMERSKYDRIIDATGVSRVLLPLIPDDVLLPCCQWRIQTGIELMNQIKLGKIGYTWCFPLSNHEYHIGCGSLISDPQKIMKDIGWIENLTESRNNKILCSCKGKIRLTAPQHSQPFIQNEGGVEVWGVGEAIGCVAPLAGDGIVPGLKSAQILVDHWDDPAGYKDAILREFSWMENERRVINKLRENNSLGMKDAWVLKKNSRRMGMRVGLKESLLLLKNLR